MVSELEVAIIGAGAAGLSAANLLARSNINFAIYDIADEKSLKENSHSAHNFLSRDRSRKSEMLLESRADLLKYGIEVRQETASEIVRFAGNITVNFKSGHRIKTKKLIIAVGSELDENKLFSIPGSRDMWAKSFFHCPFCDAYEFNNKTLGLLYGGVNDLNYLKLVSQWSSKLVYFSHGEQVDPAIESFLYKMNKSNLVVTDIIREFVHEGGLVKSAETAGMQSVPVDAMFTIGVRYVDNPLIRKLGIQMSETRFSQMSIPLTDPIGKTSDPNIFIVGDAKSLLSSIPQSAHEGYVAASAIVFDLIGERVAS